MTDAVKVALAQIDLVVGDVGGNTAKIIEHAQRARDTDGADIAVFPELSVCGYPPEDLLFHAGLRLDVEAAVAEIRNKVFGIAVLIGFPEYDDEHIYNACAVLKRGPRTLPQATAAELCRLRRRALFQGGEGLRGVQAQRHTHWPEHL